LGEQNRCDLNTGYVPGPKKGEALHFCAELLYLKRWLAFIRLLV